VAVQTLLPLAGLLPVILLPVRAGGPSRFYAVCALVLTFGFLYFGARFALRGSGTAARRLLTASIIYLPALLLLMIFA
jgi:heme o synthase